MNRQTLIRPDVSTISARTRLTRLNSAVCLAGVWFCLWDKFRRDDAANRWSIRDSMGQAPILAYMCYEKLLKFFGKRKSRQSADRVSDDRRNFTPSTNFVDHRCGCSERSVVTLPSSRSSTTMTREREVAQEKLRGEQNSKPGCAKSAVHDFSSHRHLQIPRQPPPAHPNYSPAAVTSSLPPKQMTTYVS